MRCISYLGVIMKSRLFFQKLLIGLLILILSSNLLLGKDEINYPNSLTIDRYLLDIFQQSDLKTFKINQYFYINNTGNSSFNDTFYLWLPKNSKIISDCCGGSPNMACRFDANDEMWCFYFNETGDENLYIGYPIANGSKLSYYGQKESFLITIFSSTNNSLGVDTLQLNATMGSSNILREKEVFEGKGIHITSDNKVIGMIPWMVPYRSFNITTFEQIHIFNNGSDNEIIEISISNLPNDWKVEIWNTTSKINNVSLSPKEYKNLTLVIKAPSYLAEILVESEIEVDKDENKNQWLFKNKYLYETKLVYYQIFSTTPEGLNISSDLISAHDDAYWYDEYNRYWFLASAEDIKPNNESIISLSLKADLPVNNSPEKVDSLYVLLLVLIIFTSIVVLLLKKLNFFNKKDMKQNLKTTRKKGKIKLDDNDNSKEKISKIKELENRKKIIISAIKRVENEYNNGIINKKDFEHLKDTYKKQAIKILKEIDKFKD